MLEPTHLKSIEQNHKHEQHESHFFIYQNKQSMLVLVKGSNS